MATLSRWTLAPRRRRSPGIQWLILGLWLSFVFAAAYAFSAWIQMGLMLAAVLALRVYEVRWRQRWWNERYAERSHEDIGTFTRAFDRRSDPFDPRVIRAVWDEFAVPRGPKGVIVSVRAEDQLDEDFDIDDPEWIANEIAKRAGHSTDAWVAEPSVLADVLTVRDLIVVVSKQPMRGVAS